MKATSRAITCICALSIPFFFVTKIFAQREPVLNQIKVPHDYYFREMYLPQFTTGPGSATWSPDGMEVAFSMAGSLWRQRVNGGTATQLTNGQGYDYQPDWSPDGRWIVFTRYTGQAMELQLLDVSNGHVAPLTAGGDVNLDPRFSPDGAQLAFVSTKNTGHFRIWTGPLKEGKLESRPLSPERETKTPRYYYSQWDHQLSPSWSPDGTQLVFVANPDIVYGTGSIYTAPVAHPDQLTLIQKEETSWRNRPDWSPDGKRIVYASYLGRQWHQLWMTTASGDGNPYPLTYGKFDATHPRWSPDGKHMAYISNEGGNTALWILDVLGGKTYPLPLDKRVYLAPPSTLTIKTIQPGGGEVPARISVTGEDGRSYAPADAWAHADDAFDRGQQAFENLYFHSTGTARVSVPKGKATVTIFRGLENAIQTQTVDMATDQAITVTVPSLPLPNNWKGHWISGDVHVHMNYGGHYRNTPTRMVAQAKAEDLDIVFNTIVNKEQRIPDMDYFSTLPDTASTPDVLLTHAQEHHTSFWGHLGLLGLAGHYLIPGYSAYPNTASQSAYPTNSVIADLAHRQGALVGYVHPFYEIPNPLTESISNALPVDVALGKVDYYEVVGFSWPRQSAEVWHRLLNCGFRISAAGGTDAMANYASLRGPVGINRTYVHMEEVPGNPLQKEKAWLNGLKNGKTMATNSALLNFEVNGGSPGDEVRLQGKKSRVSYNGFMRSVVPMDHLEIIGNGKVLKSFDLKGDRTSADISGTLVVDKSMWVLLRAWNDRANASIQDYYPYATTGPIYLTANNAPIRSPEDAHYFVQWIDKVHEAASRQVYLTEEERNLVLDSIQKARGVFEAQK
ncbi:MAG: CehA/McbA family metallohydrolase [Cyclobacteriaceae bacterium]|nr:CehA/McbA family metallohydrolase [Cyclobacteriaceae bacterium]MCB9236837.1 CehA/McbA family metallohydrolase [Flammeovirgaceae bacterium]